MIHTKCFFFAIFIETKLMQIILEVLFPTNQCQCTFVISLAIFVKVQKGIQFSLPIVIIPNHHEILHLMKKKMIKISKLWECFLSPVTENTLIHVTYVHLYRTIYLMLFLVKIYSNSEDFWYLKNVIKILRVTPPPPLLFKFTLPICSTHSQKSLHFLKFVNFFLP